jgi:hypothetical protein
MNVPKTAACATSRLQHDDYRSERADTVSSCRPLAGFDPNLTAATAGRRNRAWEAAGLLDLVADLEAGQPVRDQDGEPAKGPTRT